MTNRRINKEMAANAAKKIVDARYKQAIRDMDVKLTNYADSMIKKYVPQPVLSVLEEYDKYFDWTQHISVFYRAYDSEGARSISSSALALKANIIVPRRCNYLEISEADWREGKKLIELKRQICDVNNKTEEELTEVIRSCNSETTLMKRYPEIHPYIEWPPVKALPANVTHDWVKNLMADIKKNNI